MKKLFTIIIALMLVACSKVKNQEEIKNDLIKQVPGLTKIDAINKSPVNNMYEVVIGRRLFYVTTDGKYIIFGNLIDPINKKNLTEERVMQLSKIDFSKLPLDLAIKEVNGNGKRILVVFSDPECPYCQMLEKQIVPKLKDTTIYVFLFPLPSHPKAKSYSNKIWCSNKKVDVWVNWMRNQLPIMGDENCDLSGLDKISKIGEELVQIEGTPTLILENGQILPSPLPPEQLMEVMDKAKK